MATCSASYQVCKLPSGFAVLKTAQLQAKLLLGSGPSRAALWLDHLLHARDKTCRAAGCRGKRVWCTPGRPQQPTAAPLGTFRPAHPGTCGSEAGPHEECTRLVHT